MDTDKKEKGEVEQDFPNIRYIVFIKLKELY